MFKQIPIHKNEGQSDIIPLFAGEEKCQGAVCRPKANLVFHTASQPAAGLVAEIRKKRGELRFSSLFSFVLCKRDL